MEGTRGACAQVRMFIPDGLFRNYRHFIMLGGTVTLETQNPYFSAKGLFSPGPKTCNLIHYFKIAQILLNTWHLKIVLFQAVQRWRWIGVQWWREWIQRWVLISPALSYPVQGANSSVSCQTTLKNALRVKNLKCCQLPCICETGGELHMRGAWSLGLVCMGLLC